MKRTSVIFLPLLCTLALGCGPNSVNSDLDFVSKSVYPTTPDSELTPGQTCSNPDEYRYPERIKYCRRSVSSRTKWEVIRTYDRQLSYAIANLPRGQFKVDHYIPLCLGGSNSTLNLWPQHKSVYSQTDTIEFQLCRLLQVGAVKQAIAIETIIEVKNDLSIADSLESELDRILDELGY